MCTYVTRYCKDCLWMRDGSKAGAIPAVKYCVHEMCLDSIGDPLPCEAVRNRGRCGEVGLFWEDVTKEDGLK